MTRGAGFFGWALCLLVGLAHGVQAQEQAYPGVIVDGCGGGAPGDPPIFTFAPGSAAPQMDSSQAIRVRIWRERIRPDIRLVLLRGVADTTEQGYTPDLALRRAEAVRDLLAGMRIDPASIWVRGDQTTPGTPIEHDPPFARVVTIGDPLRTVGCERELFQWRFRWFAAHCVGQSGDDATLRTCDVAVGDLGGEDRPPTRER